MWTHKSTFRSAVLGCRVFYSRAAVSPGAHNAHGWCCRAAKLLEPHRKTQNSCLQGAGLSRPCSLRATQQQGEPAKPELDTAKWGREIEQHPLHGLEITGREFQWWLICVHRISCQPAGRAIDTSEPAPSLLDQDLPHSRSEPSGLLSSGWLSPGSRSPFWTQAFACQSARSTFALHVFPPRNGFHVSHSDHSQRHTLPFLCHPSKSPYTALLPTCQPSCTERRGEPQNQGCSEAMPSI